MTSAGPDTSSSNGSAAPAAISLPKRVRRFARRGLRKLVRASWPAVEAASQTGAHIQARASGLKVVWSDTWNRTLDEALDHLPPPPVCSHDHYRELLLPTDRPKRHALVLEKDEPIALVSVRRRKSFWEPVSYQALSAFIAPAKDSRNLGRAIRALGIELRVEYGLGPESQNMGGTHCTSYDIIRIALQSDYESYWLRDGAQHQKHISSARRKCKNLHLQVDSENDIEWAINQWKSRWASSSTDEIAAAADRWSFWRAIFRAPEKDGQMKIRSYTLYDGDKPVASVVNSAVGDVQFGQCLTMLDDYRKRGAGTRIIDASLAQAAAQGYSFLDLGGGHGYKLLWGPVVGQRYGVWFVPGLLRKLRPFRAWPS
jgi:GNAT superfamily N-acetyltransferase